MKGAAEPTRRDSAVADAPGGGRRPGFGFRLGWALLAVGPGGLAPAADSPRAGAAVELPPMLVEESVSSVPWLYVNAGGTEFLSRCSPSTTRALAEAWLTKLQLVQALVPPEFLVRMDVPSVFVLYSQDLRQTVSVEIQRELQRDRARSGEGEEGGGGVNIALSMRLGDRDMHASIAYIDEALFDGAALSVAPGHVHYLLRGRVPDLPGWLVDGLERTYRRADVLHEPITLSPLVWLNAGESSALGSDAARPRALLPPGELLASEAERATQNRHPRRAEVRAATQELFVRWGIVSGERNREAFWRFAARCAEGPVTEEDFERYFGFGYSELRDRLSDFLPEAVERTIWIDPGRPPPLPRIEVGRATVNEIARVRGEWERLAIGHVQRRLPQVREPYVAQARRTLRRAYDAGDRDPRLLATMGLCEVDAGNDAGAREFLEPAVAAGVVRPRAGYELARLRFTELRQGAPDSATFSYTQLAPVLAPLRLAVKQAPPLAEVFVLLAEAWACCEVAPTTEELAELELGARYFGQRPAVGYAIARALAKHGRSAAAIAALEAGAASVPDESTRDSIARLRSELAVSGSRRSGQPEPAGQR